MAMSRFKQKTRRKGASPALKKTQQQVIALRGRLRTVRAGSTGVQAVGKDWKTAMKLAAGVNGGAAAGGALVAMQPELLGFDSRLVAGASFMAVGAFFLKGDAAAITVCAGAGMVAGWTQDYVQTMVSATTSTTTDPNQ